MELTKPTAMVSVPAGWTLIGGFVVARGGVELPTV